MRKRGIALGLLRKGILTYPEDLTKGWLDRMADARLNTLGFEEVTSFGCYLGPDYDALHGEASLKEYGEILNR